MIVSIKKGIQKKNKMRQRHRILKKERKKSDAEMKMRKILIKISKGRNYKIKEK